MDFDGKSPWEVKEGEGKSFIGLRQVPPITQHEVVEEDSQLQLRKLRPGAQTGAAAIGHEVVAHRFASRVGTLQRRENSTTVN